MNNLRRILLAVMALTLSACSDVTIYKDCTLATGDGFAQIKVSPNSIAVSTADNPSDDVYFMDGQSFEDDKISVYSHNRLYRHIVTVKSALSKKRYMRFKINNFTKDFEITFFKDVNSNDNDIVLYGKCDAKGTK